MKNMINDIKNNYCLIGFMTGSIFMYIVNIYKIKILKNKINELEVKNKDYIEQMMVLEQSPNNINKNIGLKLPKIYKNTKKYNIKLDNISE